MFQRALSGGGGGTSGIPLDVFTAYITTNPSVTHSVAFMFDTTGKSTLKIKVNSAAYTPAYYKSSGSAWVNFTNNQELTLDVTSDNSVSFGFNNNRNQYATTMQILEFSLT